jgi:hypothetical protein
MLAGRRNLVRMRWGLMPLLVAQASEVVASLDANARVERVKTMTRSDIELCKSSRLNLRIEKSKPTSVLVGPRLARPGSPTIAFSFPASQVCAAPAAAWLACLSTHRRANRLPPRQSRGRSQKAARIEPCHQA